MKYDLEERTAIFSENVIELCQSIPRNAVSTPLISQTIRSATSVGANYREANGASSKKDFRNKILICKREILETKYWFRLLLKTSPNINAQCQKLILEAQELILIFSKIAANSNPKAT